MYARCVLAFVQKPVPSVILGGRTQKFTLRVEFPREHTNPYEHLVTLSLLHQVPKVQLAGARWTGKLGLMLVLLVEVEVVVEDEVVLVVVLALTQC